MEAATKSNSAIQMRSTKPHQTETKKPVQQSKGHEGPQLAIPLMGTNFDALEVVLVCKKLADSYLHADAYNEIGLAFLQTPYHNPEAFDTEAFKYFRLAAESGSKEGQNNLAYMYENGRGVDKNMAAAVKWYKKAAGQNLDIAKSNLERLEGILQSNSKENTAVKNNLGLIYGNSRRVFEGNGLDKKNTATTKSQANSVKPHINRNNKT